MAYLKSKTLFFTTSPRTPLKMIPEIEALSNGFEGKEWNTGTQIEFIKVLAEGKDFQGEGSAKEMAGEKFYKWKENRRSTVKAVTKVSVAIPLSYGANTD